MTDLLEIELAINDSSDDKLSEDEVITNFLPLLREIFSNVTTGMNRAAILEFINNGNLVEDLPNILAKAWQLAKGQLATAAAAPAGGGARADRFTTPAYSAAVARSQEQLKAAGAAEAARHDNGAQPAVKPPSPFAWP